MPIENDCQSSRISRRSALKSVGAGGLVLLAGCSGDGSSTDSTDTATSSGSTATGETIKIGQTLVGPAQGSLWNTACVNALESAASKYDWLEYSTKEKVGASDAEQYFRNFADQDYDLVIGANFNYGDIISRIAPDISGTHFEVCGGVQKSKMQGSMGIFYTKFYEASYLAGMAAGMMTESNVLGYVTPFAIATTLRRVNAYFLGARATNPDVTMKVRYTNAWYDPGASSQAVNALIDEGADVIHSGTDSKAPIETARDNDVWSVGMYIPEMSEAGGDKYITGVLTRFETPYKNAITKVHSGNWKPTWRWDGIQEGFVDIDDWGPQVSQDVKDEVSTAREKALDGELNYWKGTQFEGKSETSLYNNMGSYVEGIEGSVPSN